jgi:hypothetical protein
VIKENGSTCWRARSAGKTALRVPSCDAPEIGRDWPIAKHSRIRHTFWYFLLRSESVEYALLIPFAHVLNGRFFQTDVHRWNTSGRM